jgi:hypothetical protein
MIALSLTLGAVQLASGRDLAGSLQDSTGTPEAAVNRAAKADRAAGVAAPVVQTQTISIRPDGLADTSVLVRVPVTLVARNSSSARSMTSPSDRKMAVACEPVVSVLTEVAKRLQPGRCVT